MPSLTAVRPRGYDALAPRGADGTAAVSSTPGAAAHEQLRSACEGWLDSELRAAERARWARWQPDFASLDGYLASTRSLRQALVECLALTSPPPPGDLFTVRTVGQWAGCALDELRWSPWPGVAQDALLLRVDHHRRPTVVVTHGLTSSPEQCLGLSGPHPVTPLLQHLTAAGLNVVVPRLVAGWQARLRLARKARLLGREWLGLELVGLLRLVDRLAAMPAVAADALGVVGFSRGGQLAMLAAALDGRFRAVVVASWFTDRAAKLLDTGDARQPGYLASPEDEQFVPGWLSAFDDVLLAGLIAPRPLLVTSRLDDPVISYEQTEARFAEVARLYARLDFAEFCRLALLPGGHAPLPETTAQFCQEWLTSRDVAATEPTAPAPVQPAAQHRRRRSRPVVWQAVRRRRR